MDSADLGISNVLMENNSSNIFSKSIYIPSTLQDLCTYSVSIYSKRTGELLQTNNYIVTVNNLKLTNLRISLIADPRWQNYFEMPGNHRPTALQAAGIQTRDMPVYRNREQSGIKLGYMARFKIDSFGLNNTGDTIAVNTDFFIMDSRNLLYRADVYVQEEAGNYMLLENSSYVNDMKRLKISSDKRQSSETNPGNSRYNTWNFSYYLPPTAKVVKHGELLNLELDNTQRGNLLVVFKISGVKASTGQTCDYNKIDGSWAAGNGGVYGRNRPSGQDLIMKGINNGEVFWYNLDENALEDLRFNRTW